MKKIKNILIMALLLMPFATVSAQSNIYYTNNNNVSMTEEEYNYLLNFYGTKALENMSLEKFESEINNELILKSSEEKFIKTLTYVDINGNATSNDIEITEEEYNNPISLASNCESGTAVSCWETSYKKLTLNAWVEASSTSTYLRLVLINTWKIIPSVRSYDVIGLRYYNYVPYDGFGDQSVYSWSSGYQNITYSYNGSNINKKSNGVGISQNLLDNSDAYDITNRLVLDGNTTSNTLGVYGSYQHANQEVTLAQSKNYNFGNGLGGVFVFNSGIGSKYDAMQGVSYVY